MGYFNFRSELIEFIGYIGFFRTYGVDSFKMLKQSINCTKSRFLNKIESGQTIKTSVNEKSASRNVNTTKTIN